MVTRLDQAIVDRALAGSKSKAQQMITQGGVQVNGAMARKASQQVSENDVVEIVHDACPWVSRGGLKLAHALAHFNANVSGMLALDVGASTGGFTDVLLTHGAAKVYAVDVGSDQLHEKLRADSRVLSLEQLNARGLTEQQIPEPIDVIVCDASFISLEKVLPAALGLARRNAQLITLIKPQFEVGKQRLGKGGVVKDEALHEEVCLQVNKWITQLGWQVKGVTKSPVVGPKGNKEFLLYAIKSV